MALNSLNKTRVGFGAGVVDILPMLVGMVPFGLLVGAMGTQAGLDVWEVVLMSSAVFAGASQFIALDMWTSPLPALALIGTTFLVNLRHVLMGAAAAPHIKSLPVWVRYPFLYAMADENWAMAIRKISMDKKIAAGYLMGLTIPFYLNWQIWSYAGTQLGGLIADPRMFGFDFVFTAVFICLILGFWKHDRRLTPILASAVAALVAANILPGTWYIFIGSIVGVSVAAITYKQRGEAP